MARPSKLSDKQWLEVERRHVKGEKIRALAREFGVSEGAIRARVSTQSSEIKAVAHQIVAAEQRFNALPISAQVSARSLADDLREISSHLSSAAKYGSMTAHRIAGIANAQIDKIDDADPMESQETLQAISALTKISNDASVIPMALLNANRDFVRDMNSGGNQSNADVLKELVQSLPL